MKRRMVLAAAAALTAAGFGRGRAQAQAPAWPTKPITMYVPFAAGGPSDLFGRILARGLQAELGQPVVKASGAKLE